MYLIHCTYYSVLIKETFTEFLVHARYWARFEGFEILSGSICP